MTLTIEGLLFLFLAYTFFCGLFPNNSEYSSGQHQLFPTVRTEVGNSDRQAHSIISFQQEIVKNLDWLLVHVQCATGISSGVPDIYFSCISSPLETDFKVRQDRRR